MNKKIVLLMLCCCIIPARGFPRNDLEIMTWQPHDFEFKSRSAVSNPFTLPFSADFIGTNGIRLNIATAAPPIAMKMIQSKPLDNHLFLYSPMIFSLLAILTMTNNKGTAATPFNTAAYTKAFTGSMPTKLMSNPIRVAIQITE